MRFTVYFNCSTLSMMWLLAFSREHGRGLRRLYDRRPASPVNECMATASRPTPTYCIHIQYPQTQVLATRCGRTVSESQRARKYPAVVKARAGPEQGLTRAWGRPAG